MSVVCPEFASSALRLVIIYCLQLNGYYTIQLKDTDLFTNLSFTTECASKTQCFELNEHQNYGVHVKICIA